MNLAPPNYTAGVLVISLQHPIIGIQKAACVIASYEKTFRMLYVTPHKYQNKTETNLVSSPTSVVIILTKRCKFVDITLHTLYITSEPTLKKPYFPSLFTASVLSMSWQEIKHCKYGMSPMTSC
jgi:hypothetical protein